MSNGPAISLCPMCRMAPVAWSRRLAGLIAGPMRCPACGAQYRRVGEHIQLTWANPQKMVAIGASANPMAPPAFGFRGFYLGEALLREEWERIAAGGESDAFRQWVETSIRYAQGDLPFVVSPVDVPLRERESAHHAAHPAWLSLSEDPISGVDRTPGTLVVTNQRLLFHTDQLVYAVAWPDVDHIAEIPPAIFVHESLVPEPVLCYVPPLDPAFAAMKGAWQRSQALGDSS